jgi:DNA-binding NtrC family response regulator
MPTPPVVGSRFILVAAEQSAAAVIASHLRKLAGVACHIETYGTVRNRLARDGEEVLTLVVASRNDLEPARQLIQETTIQKLPLIVIVLAPEQTCDEAVLELEQHVSHLLLWPRDASTLAQVIKSCHQRRREQGYGGYPEDSIEGLLARRLMTYTPSLLPMVEQLALAAAHDVTVLITGETGTGKTFLARLIHDFSPRRDERFLIVPCGAIAPNLVESEFFGHVKGAFTGADRTKVGKFGAAGNGTLLLDEIDALGLEQQANLLRVVETGEYEPVGSTETHKTNCRIIVASNRNLKEEADRGKFRQDLYYRFNVMSFHLPPLRERLEDIAPLVRGFAARFATKFRKELYDISTEAMAAFETYQWPGNLRELENAVQHAVLMSQGKALLPRHLPETIQTKAFATPSSPRMSVDTLVHNREVIERTVIQRALANNGYSRARAANELGISRVTLYKKMKKYGLMKPPVPPPLAQ